MRSMRFIKCINCGSIYSERKIRKYNREHNFSLDYTPPCFNCGGNDYILFSGKGLRSSQIRESLLEKKEYTPKIDRMFCKSLRAEINEALNRIGKKYNMTLKLERAISFTDTDVRGGFEGFLKGVKMTLNELQLYSDQVCEHFGMRRIPVVENRRLRKTLGVYKGDKIELASRGKRLFVLRHELAHHLHYTRYEQRKEGYVKIEMRPKMVLDSVDEKGQKRYAPRGKLSPVYIKVGTSHGKLFKKCLKEIKAFDLELMK